MKFQDNELPICGSLHPATREGFVAMLREANEALTAGYDLIGLERIEKQLGAVYRKRDQSLTALQNDRPALVGEGL
jgi:hypothetical protein